MARSSRPSFDAVRTDGEHAIVLPLRERWYRKLLAVSLLLGVAGGVIAVTYAGVTGFGIDALYGDPTSEWWSGRWWWIPLIAIGAVVVMALRTAWSVPEDVPGAIGFAKAGWVDPSSAVSLVVVSAVSLIAGASLGPSFGVIVAGGGLGALVSMRTTGATDEARTEYTVTGMSGALGGVFSAPLLGAVMASELSPSPKSSYVAAFMPQFTSASLGYVVFYTITGSVMLDSFEVGDYTFETIHLLYGVGLGLASVLLLIAFSVVQKAVGRVLGMIGNRFARALVGGAAIGAIAYAAPLTATGGSSQLAFATANASTLGTGLLLVVILGKMVAVALSEEAGFLGGTVFPILFLGGAAGLVMAGVFESVPAALAVAAMVAAVPGATIGAPIGFILIAVGGVGLGISAVAPIGLAVVTSYLTASAIFLALGARTEATKDHASSEAAE